MTNGGEPVILPLALEHFRGHAVARALSSVAELPATLAGL
jgi:hypothetical protein